MEAVRGAGVPKQVSEGKIAWRDFFFLLPPHMMLVVVLVHGNDGATAWYERMS